MQPEHVQPAGALSTSGGLCGSLRRRRLVDRAEAEGSSFLEGVRVRDARGEEGRAGRRAGGREDPRAGSRSCRGGAEGAAEAGGSRPETTGGGSSRRVGAVVAAVAGAEGSRRAGVGRPSQDAGPCWAAAGRGLRSAVVAAGAVGGRGPEAEGEPDPTGVGAAAQPPMRPPQPAEEEQGASGRQEAPRRTAR